MKISKDTENVIEALEQFTQAGLRKKNDTSIIFEICAAKGAVTALNQMVFAGKKIWNLSSKLRKVDPNADGINLLQKELQSSVEEMQDYLEQLSKYMDKEDKQRVIDIYLPKTRGGLKNIVDLSYDLAKFKDLQTESKKQSNQR